MMDCLVLDASEKTQRVASLDRFGRYHVAQVVDSLPPVGVSLIGTFPMAGPQVLIAEPNGDAYRVTFADVDCSRQVTFDRLPE